MLSILILVGIFAAIMLAGLGLYCIWNTISGDQSMFRD